MALTSDHQSSSPTTNTPTGYRLNTEAVLVVSRPIATEQLLVIRRTIQPRRGWWQFELRPWHYWAAIGSAAVIATAFVALLVHVEAFR